MYGLCQRFFDIDIFPRLAGQDSNPRVPVIGRCNDDAIDVFVVQQSLELFGRPGCLALGFFEIRVDLVEDVLVNITKSFDLGPHCNSTQGVTAALIAASNQTQHHLVIGPHGARVPIQEGAGG